MADSQKENGVEKANTFFVRAEEVALTHNFDYAIDMYLEGLKCAPDALEGHLALRKFALDRRSKNGKKPSVIEKVKHHGGKTPLEEMLNAEYLLARDPDHLPYAEALLKAAATGGYKKTVAWIAQVIFEVNRNSNKPSFATYVLLKDCYAKAEMFNEAINACKYAIELKKNHPELLDEMRDLCAKMTVRDGKYGQAEDFRDSIRDKKKQEKLHAQDGAVKSPEYLAEALDDAKKAFDANPESPVNILELAEAHFDLGTEQGYKDSLIVLQKASLKYKEFTFKRRIGELKIRKFKENIRSAKAAVDADPDNKELKKKFDEALEHFAALELEHYKGCVANYSTDLHMKYEYALRLLVNNQYNDAIPLFQEAQRDPQRRIHAMDKTGLCFFFKGWYTDAIDIFKKALDSCEIKDSAIAKELRYNLARSYQQVSRTQEALDIFRKLAQLDFNYKDVAKRVDDLRNLKE
jgi:tetratricopeptide (TPR) repeat protein